jgi:uncharacterized protein
MHFREESPGTANMLASYGGGGFSTGEDRIDGSVLISARHFGRWTVASIGDASMANLDALVVQDPRLEVLLIGSGNEIIPLCEELKEKLAEAKIAVDVMGTGAAARTYNVLQSEGRRVGAALIAIEQK